MQRIAIIGCAGSGKSTLARQLGPLLGLQVFHLDRLFWHSGWVPTPRDQWVAIQEQLVQGEGWIIDGNYDSTLEIRLQAADTIIFLDYPRRIYLYRAIRRSFVGRNNRPDMAEGCPEHIDWEFLRWIWQFPRKDRLSVIAKLDAVKADKQVIVLRTPKATAAFLDSLSSR